MAVKVRTTMWGAVPARPGQATKHCEDTISRAHYACTLGYPGSKPGSVGHARVGILLHPLGPLLGNALGMIPRGKNSTPV